MSQEKIADLLGVTFQQVQKYEKGVNRVAASRLLDIADALDTDVNYFFVGLRAAGDAGEADSEEGRAMTRDEAELLALFRSAPKRVRLKILGLVRALNEQKS